MRKTWKTEKRSNEPIYIEESDIDHMCSTELIELLNRAGVRASRAFSTNELQGLLRAACKGEKVSVSNPIDKLREIMNEVTSTYIAKVQLPPGCPADCYQHPDPMVVHCSSVNIININTIMKKRREKKNG